MYRVENRNLQVNVRLSPDSSFPAGPCLEQKNCEKRDRNVIFFFRATLCPTTLVVNKEMRRRTLNSSIRYTTFFLKLLLQLEFSSLI